MAFLELLTAGLGLTGQAVSLYGEATAEGGSGKTTRKVRAGVEASYAAALDPWIKAMGARVPPHMRSLRTAGPLFGPDPAGARTVGYPGANVEVFANRAEAEGFSPGPVSWPSLYPGDYGRMRSWYPAVSSGSVGLSGGSGNMAVTSENVTSKDFQGTISSLERESSGIIDRLSNLAERRLGDVSRSFTPQVRVSGGLDDRTLILVAVAVVLAVIVGLALSRRRR